MSDFIETRIIEAIKKLLTGRVNEILQNDEFDVPVIEFNNYTSEKMISPSVVLAFCESSEKERLIKLDTYSLIITFELPETIESELQCYAYCAAICKALKENPTLGGIADRAVVTGEKFVPPKKPLCGQGWGVVISLRVTVETN